ncbi:MAG: hypothetical protein WCT03_12445 [Candidatus Obscuribacterales bacterium]
MANIESLLLAIENGDGKSVRDFLIAFSFETQLNIARRLQTLNTRRRNQKAVDSSAIPPTIYAQFEMVESSGCTQERLTVRVVQDGRAKDIYSIQKNNKTGRLLVRFQFQGSPIRAHGTLTLSKVETHQSENFAPDSANKADEQFNQAYSLAYNPGPDGFSALNPLNMAG